MTTPFESWDEIVAYALSLPETELTPFYGVPCPKVNARAFVAPGREAGSFCLFTNGLDEKAMLIGTDPETFWETPHYRNYPALLARFGTGARERLETYIARAWWDRLKKAQRERFGPRP